jgi:hypothetical protein
MKAAYARATSARLAGDVGQPGQTFPIDIAMTRTDDVSGLYSYDGVATTIVITRGRTYVLLNPAYYRYLVGQGNVLSAPCTSICGRYVLRNLAKSPLQGLFRAYVQMFPLSIEVTAKTPVRAVSYQDQAAYEFTDSNGDRIYISRRHYPYAIAVVNSGDTIRFSQWNAVPSITAPPVNQIITESSLFVGG